MIGSCSHSSGVEASAGPREAQRQSDAEQIDQSADVLRALRRYVRGRGRHGDRRRLRERAARAFCRSQPLARQCAGALAVSKTPTDDPAFIYQDTLVALDAARSINIGQPSSHAFWLGALAPAVGETIVQVGAGTGYYTAILAHLVGAGGHVHAFEIDAALAARAAANLQAVPQAIVHARSGIADDLPKADGVYVCAGVTQPAQPWLDALWPGGRLLFPLQAPESLGGMLLIRRTEGAAWPATFVSRAAFVGCAAPQDAKASERLAAAFSGAWNAVKSYRTDQPDATCWYTGEGWWLSTREADAVAPGEP